MVRGTLVILEVVLQSEENILRFFTSTNINLIILSEEVNMILVISSLNNSVK